MLFENKIKIIKKRLYLRKNKINKNKQLKTKSNILSSKIIIIIIFFNFYLILLHKKYRKYKIIKQYFNLNKIEIIDKYLYPIPEKYEKDKQIERGILIDFLSLKIIPNNPNEASYCEIKSALLREFNKINEKNISNIEMLFIMKPFNFGNRMISLNNIMYYCEILGIKNLYLNSEYIEWYIKDTIITDKINISAIPINKINCNENNIICININKFGRLFYPIVVRPEIRITLLKNEIRKNLPKVDIDSKDLVIHIRSGDIFSFFISPFYTQPPFCFYESILLNFKFRNIYLISQTQNNPVINKLLTEFPTIIFKKNNIDIDISYICNAYNLVGSISSFLLSSTKLNDNLKNYFEYDIFRNSHKYFFLHQDYFYFPRKFIYYKMKPSDVYLKEMFAWRKTEYQIKLMLEDKCTYNFTIIEHIK